MSLKSQFFFCLLILGLLTSFLYGQSSTKGNIGFQNGSFKGWTGYNWRIYINNPNSPETSTSPQTNTIYTLHGDTIGNATINSTDSHRRQLIISDTTAYDINTGYKLKKIPIGYKYSARLGDAMTTSDSYPRGWEQSLQYKLKVDSTNSLLILKFACVLEYAPDHNSNVEPRFKLTLYDSGGKAITTCTDYDVYASSGSVSGFQTYDYSKNNGNTGYSSGIISWRDWTTVGADLSAYKGQTITIEFMAADCRQIHHFGYAYFVAECHPLQITVNYCKGDTAAILTAPDGFSSYKWTTGNASDTTQNLILYNPVEGAKYQCSFTSVMGCSATLESTIAKYLPVADFTSHMQDCDSNIVKFNNFSTSNKAPINYEWDFGDGTTSSDLSPQHKFTTSGSDQQVKLTVSNPPSSCKSILSKTIPLFARPLVGISGDSTYCRGETTTITAYGGYHYLWSNGDTVTTITTGSPSNYWVIGYSTTRDCQSKPILRQVLEEPDWQISIAGDTLFCTGDSTVVTASGAVKYLWDSGSSNNSITVSEGGNYTVEGENLKGCKRSNTVSVVKDALPLVDFTLSSNTINNKFNYVTFCIPQQQDVTYAWNFGDGSTDTQSCGNHYFALSGEVGMFLVTLTATNKNGCVNQSSKTVIVEPFIPNVFSPNSDGHNDLFMPNYEMQIFDRQGILIYQGTKNSKGWDGTFNGQKVDPDTYYYILQYTDYLQQQHTRKGYVTLVR